MWCLARLCNHPSSFRQKFIKLVEMKNKTRFWPHFYSNIFFFVKIYSNCAFLSHCNIYQWAARDNKRNKCKFNYLYSSKILINITMYINANEQLRKPVTERVEIKKSSEIFRKPISVMLEVNANWTEFGYDSQWQI